MSFMAPSIELKILNFNNEYVLCLILAKYSIIYGYLLSGELIECHC